MTDQAVSAHTPAYAAADLTNCDREPIHIPGAIQPHGVLLALSEDLQTVVMASANCARMLGTGVEDLLGRDLADVLGAEAADAVRRAATAPHAETLRVQLPGLAGRSAALPSEVDLAVHRSGDRAVVEVEGAEGSTEAVGIYRGARGTMVRLARSATLADLVDSLATEVADLTGFDRVMVYRFDPDWNGEVVAERRRPDLNPFLGLHYPSTDIPAQARRLYTVNWVRLIADISYTPVPLVPVHDPDTERPLDLSHSTLRSVSPIHVEYLANMGVTASMSVSLVVDGRLWGLIACHHYSGPHALSLDVRNAAEFIGQAASSLVAARERADVAAEVRRMEAILEGLVARTAAAGPQALDVLMADPELLDLLQAGGVALCSDNVVTTRGDVPPERALRRIAQLLRRPDSRAGTSSHLGALDPSLAEVSGLAAGALVIGSAPDRWLCFVRPELREVVDWGGDPTNKLLAQQEGPEVRLSPRKSFEKWQQVVRGRSARWGTWHEDVAESLASQLATLLYASTREQVHMAESLQRSVIPDQAPTYAGLEVAARYLPASTYQLGGDWWDSFRLPDGRIAFVVGDVAGHGVEAATTMTQLRAAVRAHLLAGETPAEALDRTDVFMDGLREHIIATMVLAVVEPGTGRTVLSSAGHPPPLLVRDDAGRQTHELAVATRPLLGLGLRAATETEIVLEPGEWLVLYTDGLVERRGVDLTESLATLTKVAGQGPGPGAVEPWVDRLLAEMPGRRDDDVTLLAVSLAAGP